MSFKQCCASGSLHTGTPTGKLGKVYGLDCYTAEPPNGSPKGIVVIIPDAFGLPLPNNKILADEYAKKGNFKVYLPEFMDGVVIPEDALISIKAFTATGFWAQLNKVVHALYIARCAIPWLWYTRKAAARPKIFNFLKAVRKNDPGLPIGVAGFCWGGQHVAELCWNEQRTDDGKRLVDCGFTAHPSALKYYDDLEKVVLPFSVAASEHDFQMSAEQATKTEEILKGKSAKTRDESIVHEFVMYKGAHHGFAVRADEEDKHEADCGKQAEAQAIAWFDKWFSNPPKL